MVVRVKLKGLKIVRNKAGRYFVYIRGTRKAILKNFEGDRNVLLARLAEPDMLTLYNAYRKRDLNRVYAEGTLGSLVAWFKADCPRYAKLAEATRDDYDKAFVRRAAKAATATIPIAFTTIADPVQIGFVTSLNRPSGNLTGVTLLAVEVGPKLLEILSGVVPSATIIALLVNPTNPNSEMQSKNTQEAAHRLGLELRILNASVESDFDTVFKKLRELRASALIIAQDMYFDAESTRLAALTVRHAIPAIYPLPEFAAAGGLFSYGASLIDAWRQTGIYVGRILKGEKPAELPVVQPTKFQLTINLKTADALGLTVPPSLLASADEVIE
jgi:ABC-type uncharacterized transport system substrate-binding protein